MKPSHRKLIPRFHSSFVIQKVTGCWVWTRGVGGNGYGQMYVGKRKVYAHRYAYEIYVGSCDGLNVLHKCDNPPCVNPAHLFIGTQGDNVRDMLEKGRHVSPAVAGEAHGRATVTEEQVREVRRMRGLTMSCPRISELTGIPLSTVQDIASKRTWKNLA